MEVLDGRGHDRAAGRERLLDGRKPAENLMELLDGRKLYRLGRSEQADH
jgi:hypothetical protein